jgi:ribosomal protein S18 acetylase RimI-like enzyme
MADRPLRPDAATTFRIEPMSPADIPAVVALQVTSLDGSIVTELGHAFLNRFHRLALAHDTSRALVAKDDGRLVGFALGALDVHAFNRHVKPRVIGAIVRALLSPSRIRLAGSLVRSILEGEPQPPIPAELLLLVVDAGARRRGVGAALLAALESSFARQGAARYRVAVRSHLAAARAFYSAERFALEQERQVLGRPMVYLIKDLGTG